MNTLSNSPDGKNAAVTKKVRPDNQKERVEGAQRRKGPRRETFSLRREGGFLKRSEEEQLKEIEERSLVQEEDFGERGRRGELRRMRGKKKKTKGDWACIKLTANN